MMNVKKELLDLARYAIKRQVPANFDNGASLSDIETALRGEIKEMLGSNRYEYEQNKWSVFALISIIMTEHLPNSVIEYIGRFATVAHFADNDRPVFKVKKGHARAKQFVTKVGPAGTYETFRLDREQIEIGMDAVGSAVIIDFERYLSGLEDLIDVFSIVMDEMTSKIFFSIQETLLATWNNAGRPAANQVSMTSFNVDQMVAICRTVAAYGEGAIILCSVDFASKMTNLVGFTNANPNMPGQDLVDIRSIGYIGTFRGFPVITMPNSFTDETNTHLSLNPRVAYVLPSGRDTRPVYLAFEGDTQIHSFQNKGDRSHEIQVYQKWGTAVVAPLNSWAIVQNLDIEGMGWDAMS